MNMACIEAEPQYISIVVDTFGTDKMLELQQQFLRGADVFEPGKRLVTFDRYDCEVHPFSTAESIAQKFKDAFQHVGGQAVFIGVRPVESKDAHLAGCWVAEGVQSIAIPQSGKLKWGIFADILTQMGYDVETNKNMGVQTVRPFKK